MRNQLIPPRDLAPVLPPQTTAAESVRIWIDLMKSTEKMLLAGLAREVGPDLATDAHRRWCAEQFERHGAHMVALASKLRNAGE